jgi:hypothetical protein
MLPALIGLPSSARSEPPTDLLIRQSVEKSLPFLEREGVAWIKGRGCMSCHNFTFTLWSHLEAQRRGIPVEARKIAEWSRWAREDKDADGADEGYQLLLAGVPAAGYAPDAPWPRTLAEPVRKRQRPDGSWKAGGQLPSQKRPVRETDEVTTAWVALALASLRGPDEAVEKALGAARERLRGVPMGESNESLVVLLLVEGKLGTRNRSKVLLQELRQRQNADGGWAWRIGGPSDAFATGQSLYALSIRGVSANDPVIRRGRRYLLDTQEPDGGWYVAPESITGTSGEQRLKKLHPIYRYWGTAWATIGLLNTLPAVSGKE